MKVTDVPVHTGFVPVAAETLTGRFGFTVMVTVFELAGEPVAHVALEVNIQVTASVLLGV